MIKLQQFNKKVRSSAKRPELAAGDIVKIHRKIKEGNKERVQVFEGIVIAVKGKQSSSPMVTVRRVSFGVGVEITVPVFSPSISKIEVAKRAKTRRSKLYFLRRKDFKVSKMKTKDLERFVAEEKPEPMEEAKDEAPEKKESAEKVVSKPENKKAEKNKP